MMPPYLRLSEELRLEIAILVVSTEDGVASVGNLRLTCHALEPAATTALAQQGELKDRFNIELDEEGMRLLDEMTQPGRIGPLIRAISFRYRITTADTLEIFSANRLHAPSVYGQLDVQAFPVVPSNSPDFLHKSMRMAVRLTYYLAKLKALRSIRYEQGKLYLIHLGKSHTGMAHWPIRSLLVAISSARMHLTELSLLQYHHGAVTRVEDISLTAKLQFHDSWLHALRHLTKLELGIQADPYIVFLHEASNARYPHFPHLMRLLERTTALKALTLRGGSHHNASIHANEIFRGDFQFKLKELHLDRVVVFDHQSLMRFLGNNCKQHMATLRLERVMLLIPLAENQSGTATYFRWRELLRFVKTNLHAEKLMLGWLTGFRRRGADVLGIEDDWTDWIMGSAIPYGDRVTDKVVLTVATTTKAAWDQEIDRLIDDVQWS